MKKKEKKHGLQNHKRRYYYSSLFLLLLFMTSCKSNRLLIDSNEVESLHFWFLPRIDTPDAIRDCESVVFDIQSNKDSVIKDRETIIKFIEIVNSLKPISPNTSYDLRVSSLIRMKEINGKRKSDVKVCMERGNVSGNCRVLLNGVLKKGDRKVIYEFLNKTLYDNYTPDDWTPSGIKEYWKAHPEERDKVLSPVP